VERQLLTVGPVCNTSEPFSACEGGKTRHNLIIVLVLKPRQCYKISSYACRLCLRVSSSKSDQAKAHWIPIRNVAKEKHMQVTKRSVFGNEHTLEIDITQEQWDRWKAGEMLQNVCPHLSADDREFLISGTTKEEWEQLFGKE